VSRSHPLALSASTPKPKGWGLRHLSCAPPVLLLGERVSHLVHLLQSNLRGHHPCRRGGGHAVLPPRPRPAVPHQSSAKPQRPAWLLYTHTIGPRVPLRPPAVKSTHSGPARVRGTIDDEPVSRAELQLQRPEQESFLTGKPAMQASQLSSRLSCARLRGDRSVASPSARAPLRTRAASADVVSGQNIRETANRRGRFP
jgi:hypothetical protein